MEKEMLIKKAKECKSIDEIISLAKESGIKVSKQEAEIIFNKIHQKDCELSDNELNTVAGGKGGCSKPRSAYDVVKFPNKESVQFIFKRGDIIEVFVSTMLDCGSSTCTMIVTKAIADKKDGSWIDKYYVDYYKKGDDGKIVITNSLGMSVDRGDIERS